MSNDPTYQNHTESPSMANFEHNRDAIREVFGVDISNKAERKFLASKSLVAFNLIYLSHYFKLEPADFHPVLAMTLQEPEISNILIEGFRGSAKSTYTSLAYPLWVGLFEVFNFIILLNDTTTQTKLNITNIRKEIEENPLIKSDFNIDIGKLKWTDEALELPSRNGGVYILGRSRGQKIRGLRYRQYRPQAVIGDDVEDLEWARKKVNRDKTFRWWTSEVVPAVDEAKSKLILVGNLLHGDALIPRLAKMGIYTILKFAVIDDDGQITWKGKYPNMEAIERQKKKVSSSSWSREYMLKIISEEEQVIHEEDIVKYNVKELSEKDDDGKFLYPTYRSGTAVDLAISEKQTADCTAIVSGRIVKYKGEEKLLIYPNPVNRRMDFATSQQVIKNQHDNMPLGNTLAVEDVAYQKAAIQELKRKGLPVKGIRPVRDKKARLETVASYIKDGKVLFADFGNEELIEQLIGFGVEKHDDLVDALVYLIMIMFNAQTGSTGVGRIDAL